MGILGAETVMVSRYTPGTRDSEGEWVEGARELIPVQMSVQPLSGRELAMLPEGERSDDWRKGFTTTCLRTSDQHDDGGRSADEVDVDGITYRVMNVRHERKVIPHYAVRMVRMREAG